MLDHVRCIRAAASAVGGLVLAAMALIPGLPKLAFIFMAVAVGMVAKSLPADAPEAIEELVEQKAGAAAATQQDDLASLLKVDELTLEIGFQLIPFVDASN